MFAPKKLSDVVECGNVGYGVKRWWIIGDFGESGYCMSRSAAFELARERYSDLEDDEND